MADNDLLNLSLPKWPKIVVSGSSITKEQAAEIIIRTSNLEFYCNDRNWTHELHDVMGTLKDTKSEYDMIDYNKLNDLKKELGVLSLQYLGNDRIASCYIGGGKGWCSWDGTIGCDGFNIGKWPSVKEVLKEWQLIAKEWPFLDLRCQLWNGEHHNPEEREDYAPVIEFVVKNGIVTLSLPNGEVKHDNETPFINLASILLGGESGCSLSQFKDAIEITRKATNKLERNK